jgi:V/A-type H+-transporting ATPase subunit D
MEAMDEASRLMSPEILEQSLLFPKQGVEVDLHKKNIMSVNVPEYIFKTKTAAAEDIFPYGYAMTSGELDDAISGLSLVFKDMLELARRKRLCSFWRLR